MTDELARLEREVAEMGAQEMIEWYCRQEGRWQDTTAVLDADEAEVAKSVRYLDLRGLLERHPERPELVRFVEKADE